MANEFCSLENYLTECVKNADHSKEGGMHKTNWTQAIWLNLVAEPLKKDCIINKGLKYQILTKKKTRCIKTKLSRWFKNVKKTGKVSETTNSQEKNEKK